MTDKAHPDIPRLSRAVLAAVVPTKDRGYALADLAEGRLSGAAVLVID